MNNLLLHILTPHSLTNARDKAISVLAYQVFKDDTGLIYWLDFNSHCNSQYCVYLISQQFQICSLVVSLLLLWISALPSSNVFVSSFITYWSLWSVTLSSWRFELGGHKKHTPSMADAVGVNSVNRDSYLGCGLPYGRHFHTGYGMFSLRFTQLWVTVHWITMKMCCIPYDNACRTRVRNLPNRLRCHF